MHGSRTVFMVVALLCVAGCPGKDKDDDKPAQSAAATAIPLPTAAATATVKSDDPATPKIEPRVKAELDGRADGITGTPLAAAGATASLQGPTGWTTTKTDFTVSTSADKKAELAVGAFTPAEGPAGKLAAATTALGLTGCTWNPAEPLTVGKTKLAATAADGLCSRGATQVHTAWVAPTAEGLLVVGGWDPGGDTANVFGAMRSIAKATGGDPTGIAACCTALRQNSKSAPPEQQVAYQAAIGMCDALKNDPQGRAILAQVRAALAGAAAPPACK